MGAVDRLHDTKGCTNAKRFVVVYRTGGTDNFAWYRTIAYCVCSIDRHLADIKRMGYHAFAEDARASYRFGLPETFDGSTPVNGRWQ